MAKRQTKKVFAVEKLINNSADKVWIRQKGQFETKEDAQAWIDAPIGVIDNPDNFRIVKEDRV
tara:strand:- start:209 stop:397 length:189 start_codon:yes stop_codon:yes gene_type:complete